MARNVTFTSALPDDIDERVEKIQARLEELKPEFEAMALELENGYLIGWKTSELTQDRKEKYYES